MAIKWEQAKEVTISVDGNKSSIWTTEKLVKNILEEANIEVTEQDEISIGLDAEVGADNKIDIQKAFEVNACRWRRRETSMVHFDYGR